MQKNRTDIHDENVAGEFFVNEQCIICDLCFELAPKVFRPSSEMEQSIVFQQPKSDVDLAWAEEARQGCPVEAIERKSM